MPMFPLGSVLLPGMPLPLHVFEPRYRALVAHCLEHEPEFGVVLIERGSEVGGGDVRTAVGTVARIVEAAAFDDGRWALGAVGVGRIRVLGWLADDPYPRAEVEEWPEEGPPPVAEALDATATALRRVLGMAAEAGVPAAPTTLELVDDPVLATHQMAAAAPFGPVDRQALLSEPGPTARLALLDRLLGELGELLEARLVMGEGPEGRFGEGPEDL
jgi:Lon protease-like protein